MIGEIYQKHSIKCLKNIWSRLQACHQPENSALFPSYILIAFASPVLTRHIRMEQDSAIRVMGHCIEALIIKELISGIKPSTNPNVPIRNDKLAWLSAILYTEIDDVKFCLECPGAVELATIVSIALGDVDSLGINVLPSDVCNAAHHTLAILSQTAKPYLEQPIAELNILDAHFGRVVMNGLSNLWVRIAATPSANVRRSCLRMCLKNLWGCAKAYQLNALKPLPSYFPSILTHLERTHPIRDQKDPVSRVVGCCFGALITTKLVADIRLRTDSNVYLNESEREYLSAQAIASSMNYDSMFGLGQPGAIEVINIVLLVSDYFNFLAADPAAPSLALNVIPQTFSILTRALPAEISTDLGLDQIDPQVYPDGQCAIVLHPSLRRLNCSKNNQSLNSTSRLRDFILSSCLVSATSS